jgi:hypothetical protein
MDTQDSTLEVRLFVYRRLDNRLEGLPDDSPRAYELHLLRKEALHEALGGVDGWKVNWFQVDDTKSHELAESFISVALNPHVQTVAIAALTWAGAEFAKAGINELAKQAASAIISRLIPEQKKGKILNFHLKFLGITIYVSRESEVDVALDTLTS